MHIYNPSDPEWMHIPSDFVIPEKRLKRQPGPVNFDELDESQKEAAELWMNYVEGKTPQHRMLCIMGWAGCGKTFLTSRMMEWMVYTKKYRIAVSAPTNKAVDIIADMTE